MSSLNILIVEGNNRQDSAFFVEAAGATAADNLKNLVLKLEPSAEVTMIIQQKIMRLKWLWTI